MDLVSFTLANLLMIDSKLYFSKKWGLDYMLHNEIVL